MNYTVTHTIVTMLVAAALLIGCSRSTESPSAVSSSSEATLRSTDIGEDSEYCFSSEQHKLQGKWLLEGAGQCIFTTHTGNQLVVGINHDEGIEVKSKKILDDIRIEEDRAIQEQWKECESLFNRSEFIACLGNTLPDDCDRVGHMDLYGSSGTVICGVCFGQECMEKKYFPEMLLDKDTLVLYYHYGPYYSRRLYFSVESKEIHVTMEEPHAYIEVIGGQTLY